MPNVQDETREDEVHKRRQQERSKRSQTRKVCAGAGHSAFRRHAMLQPRCSNANATCLTFLQADMSNQHEAAEDSEII